MASVWTVKTTVAARSALLASLVIFGSIQALTHYALNNGRQDIYTARAEELNSLAANLAAEMRGSVADHAQWTREEARQLIEEQPADSILANWLRREAHGTGCELAVIDERRQVVAAGI